MPAPKRFAILYFDFIRSIECLYASWFRRARSVVRDRRVVGDARHFYPLARESAKRRFPARSDSSNDDIYFLDADDVRFVADKFSHFRGRERRSFLCAREAKCSGRRPRDSIPLFVGKEHLCVVIGRVYVERAGEDVLLRDACKRARFKPLVNSAAALPDYTFLAHGISMNL